MIIELKSSDDINDYIDGPKMVVIDFYASWCGPCKAIAPFYETLSNKYSNIHFLKADIDNKNLEKLANTHHIESLPTFIFLYAGQRITEMKGADRKKLELIIDASSKKINEIMSNNESK